jgi:hypothetical protein
MNQLIDLPDRAEITLCEAVTAYVCAKAYDLRQWQDRDIGLTSEQVSRLSELLSRLQRAAHAGRIKFHAIKEGEDPADGFTQIDSHYFYVRPCFHWSQDVIVQENNESSRPWYFVHLDREGFAALLQEIGASVVIHETGMPGRRTSKHLVELEAQRRLDSREFPQTLTEFSRQLEAWLRENHPQAPSMTAKTISNALRQMWNAHPNCPK